MRRTIKPIADRFWSKVDQSGECWLWLAARDKDGYGLFRVTSRPGHSHQERAHRVAWFITYGPVEDRELVLHECDNPPCVRPTHLFVGDTTANRRDAAMKGHIPYPAHLAKVGADHPMAKLTDDDVREIRRLYFSEGLYQREIGDRYSLPQATISRILLRKTWRHVQ